jgi:hypothetical protein
MCTICLSAADCDDANSCTDDVCTSGICQHVNHSRSCDDGRNCTGRDVCSGGLCNGQSTCPSDATCGGSTCQCTDAAETYCDATASCEDLRTSAQSCRACGRSCRAGATCQNSACKPVGASHCTARYYGGHDYLICGSSSGGGGLSWSAARSQCLAWGYGLAIIGSAAENATLNEWSRDAYRWIGANDRGNDEAIGGSGDACRKNGNDSEGTWFWASPTDGLVDHYRRFCAFANEFASSCTAEPDAYQSWQNGEPNNSGCRCDLRSCDPGEDCALLAPDGSWNDSACSISAGYICETP